MFCGAHVASSINVPSFSVLEPPSRLSAVPSPDVPASPGSSVVLYCMTISLISPKRHPQGFCRNSRMVREELHKSFFYRIPGYRFRFIYPSILRVHLQPYRLVEIAKAYLRIGVEFIHEFSMTGARFFLENLDYLCTYIIPWMSYKFSIFKALRHFFRCDQPLLSLIVNKISYCIS